MKQLPEFASFCVDIDNEAEAAALLGLDTYLSSGEGRLGLRMFEAMLASDPDAFGFLRFEGRVGDIIEGGRFAAAQENLAVIDALFARLFPAGGRADGTMLINGIGGQTTCSEWFVGAVPMPEGREYICLDSLGTPYMAALLDTLVACLGANAGGEKVSALADIDYPLLWMASSKSGGTDETMANFQATFKLLIHAFCRVAEAGNDFESKLVTAIFNPAQPVPVWEVALADVLSAFDPSEHALIRELLLKVFSTMVFTTDHNPGKYNGWASRLTAFRRGPLVHALYEEEDDIFPSMHIPRDLGGRYNGIGANALVIAAFCGHSARAIIDTSAALAGVLRKSDPAENPLIRVAAALSIACRRLKNGNKALVVVNSPALEHSAEALVQLFPETIGKGKGCADETLFGLFPVARTACAALGDFDEKIVISVNAGAGAATAAVSDGDLAVSFSMPDSGAGNIARLIMSLEFLAMMISVFNEAAWQIAENRDLDIDDTKRVGQLIGRVRDGKWEHSAEHLIFSGALQGGVQLAKKLARDAGMLMFNVGSNTMNAADGTVLPARDEQNRTNWYLTRLKTAGFITAEFNVPGLDEVLAAAAGYKNAAGDDKIAFELAAVKKVARTNSRLLDCWAYTERSAALSDLKAFAQDGFIDILDPAPQTQHQRAQQKVEGADATLTIVLDVCKDKAGVDANEEVLIYDGCVPPYLHGLFPSEVGALYAEQYSRLLRGMPGRLSARLIFPDISKAENLKRLKAILTRAAEIYAGL